jgi:hypothetical protein
MLCYCSSARILQDYLARAFLVKICLLAQILDIARCLLGLRSQFEKGQEVCGRQQGSWDEW